MEFSHCCNAYFRWRVTTHRRKVQGFGQNDPNLAHEQSHLALKALDFKACVFIQYALQ